MAVIDSNYDASLSLLPCFPFFLWGVVCADPVSVGAYFLSLLRFSYFLNRFRWSNFLMINTIKRTMSSNRPKSVDITIIPHNPTNVEQLIQTNYSLSFNSLPCLVSHYCFKLLSNRSRENDETI